MTGRKLMRMSRVRPQDEEMDSVARREEGGRRRVMDVLFEAQRCWDNMYDFRQNRERNKRYTYGDQWSDRIEVDGCVMTEEDYIGKQGSVPLKNNFIRRIVRNVLGVYRSQHMEPTCVARDRDEQRLGETMSTVLQYNMQMNRMREVNARSLEEFLISGLVVHRKWFGWQNEMSDCWTDVVNPKYFFLDGNMRDYRGWDASLVGEIHDVDFRTLCSQFAKSPEDYHRFRDIYAYARDRQYIANYAERFGRSRLESLDFLCVSDPSRCRVIEVWRLESKPRYRCHDYNTGEVYKIEVGDYGQMVERENAERLADAASLGIDVDDVPLIDAEWFIDSYWYYYYLTPFGDVLAEGETPFEHKSHPYVFKAYPFVDGEIHSFVGDVIDQQRYINRLVTLYDFIMRASAKGALLFPEGSLPEGYSMEDLADEWSRFNGIIVYKPKPGVPMPQQVSSNSTNIGISELLNIQMKFMEDISGVNGALQGKAGFSGMSASLYSQQTQNASTSLQDVLESFSDFVKDGAIKDVKNIQQFYDDRRVRNIVGKDAQVESAPRRIREVEFDLSISESPSSPVYKAIANEMLMQLWNAKAISVEQLLENGSFPFADDLLQSIRSQQEQAQQAQMSDGLSPELAQQA